MYLLTITNQLIMAKLSRNFTQILFIVLAFFLSSTFILNAQEYDNNLIDAYEDYTDAPREVAYVHLNKSTYIKGESIGFTAYVMDKKDKQPSLLTSNLYVSIEDADKNVVKQKLIRVKNGVASNVIELDSTFSSGNYTFKAYTNWMRNFNEQNYFVESISVIDPKKEKYIEETYIDSDIDAQFLPEGGHLLNGVINNVGVVLKDAKGYSLSSAEGEVADKNGTLITSFKVNDLGIGRFPLLAKLGENYAIKITHQDEEYLFELKAKVESVGVTLSLVSHRNKARLAITTNEETLKLIKNRPYQLAIHNGDQITTTDIYFNDNLTINKAFDLGDLPVGINIFTLFNEDNKPVVERLFFNYNDLEVIASQDVSTTKLKDSVSIKLNYKNIDAEKFNNFSVSVLPQETASYNRNHNLISYTYLQPYVNGPLENVKHYFTDITEKKKLDLDNLLLTQGWSSYDWTNIFNADSNFTYTFEQGIELTANVNDKNTDATNSYMVHAFGDGQPVVVELENDNKTFTLENVYISENDELLLSEIKSNFKLKPAKLYLQSKPNAIPLLTENRVAIAPKGIYKNIRKLRSTDIIFENLNGVQELDEVLLTAEIKRIRTRTREIGHHRFGKIKVITESDRLGYSTLQQYLEANLVRVSQNEEGQMVFTTGRHANAPILGGGDGEISGSASSMTVYLDDTQLNDTSILYSYPLSQIDYIEINRGGLGYGSRGFNGVLLLYSLNESGFRTAPKKTIQKYDLPLTFSANKKFYVPKYRYYKDDFYKGYGTIDWKPELKVDANGNIVVNIAQPRVPITLFIEGIANDGSIIFEERTLSLN